MVWRDKSNIVDEIDGGVGLGMLKEKKFSRGEKDSKGCEAEDFSTTCVIFLQPRKNSYYVDLELRKIHKISCKHQNKREPSTSSRVTFPRAQRLSDCCTAT